MTEYRGMVDIMQLSGLLAFVFPAQTPGLGRSRFPW